MVVVAFHAGVLAGGWAGVDLFFALSGWLITGLLIVEVQTHDTVRLAAFWKRRIRRLLPAVGVLLMVVMILRLFQAIELRRRGFLGAITYSTNWANIFGGVSYWDRFALPDPLEHLWSLAVEEQIYLVWPLVMLGVVSLGGRAKALRTAALAIAFGSCVVTLFGAHAGWQIDRLYQGTDTRAFAFAIGAAAAGCSLRRLGNPANHALVVLALISISVVGRNGATKTSMFQGPMQAISGLGLLAVVSAAGITAGPLCWRIPRQIGLWSYGIYLFHWPLVIATRDSMSGWVQFGAVAAGSMLCAGLSYWAIEQRVRRDGLPDWRLPATLVTSVAMIIAALALTSPTIPASAAAKGDSVRFGLDFVPTSTSTKAVISTDAAADFAASNSVSLPGSVSATNTFSVPSTASANGASATTALTDSTIQAEVHRVLIVGDSMAFEMATDLINAGTARGITVAISAAPGCTMSPIKGDQANGIAAGSCVQLHASLPSDIAGFRPDVILVLIGGTWAPYRWQGVDHDPCADDGQEALAQAGIEFFDALNAARPRVAIALPPRMTGRLYDQDDQLAAPCYTAAYTALARATGAELIPLNTQVCPTIESCPEGDAMRRDGLHFLPGPSRTLSDWLIQAVM